MMDILVTGPSPIHLVTAQTLHGETTETSSTPNICLTDTFRIIFTMSHVAGMSS